MISCAAVLLLLLSLSARLAAAGEIREFTVPTLERLGNELIRASQRPDRGATDQVRKQALQTAITALQGRLFNIHYEYVVLSDPDGRRFLVYALGTTGKRDEVVLGGHFRVTVSADGARAEGVDRLSQTLMIDSPRRAGVPAGFHIAALYINQIVSNRPVETFIYLANLVKKNIYVGTPDGKMWLVGKGRMKVNSAKPGDKTEAEAARKAFNR